MRRSRVRFVLLVPAMIALAPLDASWRSARAQIPEAPGTYTNPDGTIQDPVDIPPPRRKRAQPKSDAPAPNPALDTIEEFDRARARASGTPEPEPTPRGLNGSESR
jgi:hypothetical protein